MGERRKPLQDLREEERSRIILERGKPYPWDFEPASEERNRLGLPSLLEDINAYENYWNKKESK
tara:strand:+ start:274 stop:465 length:192 start_codon:yes stop_codon:yes gene_type:complete